MDAVRRCCAMTNTHAHSFGSPEVGLVRLHLRYVDYLHPHRCQRHVANFFLCRLGSVWTSESGASSKIMSAAASASEAAAELSKGGKAFMPWGIPPSILYIGANDGGYTVQVCSEIVPHHSRTSPAYFKFRNQPLRRRQPHRETNLKSQ